MSEFNFKPNDFVVYPTHGVGKVLGIETETIGGIKVELIVVRFDAERMTLRIPTQKVGVSGLRKLSTAAMIDDAMDILKGRPRIKRTMWSRRAQEYEAKINSGDPIQISEVVRDLHRNSEQPEQSFSERQIYENALARFTREVAAVRSVEEDEALTQIMAILRPPQTLDAGKEDEAMADPEQARATP